MARGWWRPRARGQPARISFGGQIKAKRSGGKGSQSLYTSPESHPPPDRPPLRRPILLVVVVVVNVVVIVIVVLVVAVVSSSSSSSKY